MKKPTKKKAVAKPSPEPKPEEEKKEIQVVERIIEKEISTQDAFDKLTRAQLDLIKRTIAKGANDDELKMFLQVCKGAQLNPFLKQVFLVPRWDSREGKETRSIQVSIDGFRSIAESSGQYAGNEDPIFKGENILKVQKNKVAEELKVPNEATVTVYKLLEGQRYGFSATARWGEYYPGAKMGFQWHIRPFLMLGKCAEALALRKAFPKLLSGMYEESELQKQEQAPIKMQTTPDEVFKTLTALIKKATPEQLKNYKEKMNAPGEKNYTQEQKVELLKMIDTRLAELEGIPTVQVDEETPVDLPDDIK